MSEINESEIAEVTALAIKLSELAAKTQNAANDALWTHPQVATDQIKGVLLAIDTIHTIVISQVENIMSGGTDRLQS